MILLGLASLALVFVLIIVSQVRQSDQGVQLVVPSTHAQLEDAKLRAEIRNLESEQNWWRLFPSYAVVGTAIAALAGFVLTARGQLHQREADSVRRFDEQFTATVANLGSDSEALQVGAAVSMLTFLRPESEDFHEQVFLLVLANLKLAHTDQVNRLLVRVFEDAARLHLLRDEPQPLDLAWANLDRVDLAGLELAGADLAYSQLRHANLRATNLFRARGIEVHLERAVLTDARLGEARLRSAHCQGAHFHNALLMSARLEDADLRAAEFQGAHLQSAHLNGADLTGARFDDADVNDTFFAGAKFDDATRDSLRRALNLAGAHFDDAEAMLSASAGAKPASTGTTDTPT